MTRRRPVKPTEAELSILRVLWKRGPSTVREVTSALAEERGTGYTTALKLLQIMTEKGLVRRDRSARTHVYQASLPAETTQRQLLGDLLSKVFGGSAQQLVLQLLASQRTRPAELAELRQLIESMERRGGA